MNAHTPDDFDLFQFPHVPGHRGIDTSIEAAEAIAPSAGFLQGLVLAAVTEAGPNGVTVVEMSNHHGLDRMSIQPRFSELRALRKIVDSGQRRKNPSGISAIVWTLPGYEGERVG